jgi:hypothetical protein
MLDPGQQLLDLEALRRLKASYFYFLDTKQWDPWLALFTADATFRWDRACLHDQDHKTIEFTGIDSIAEHVVHKIMNGAASVHHGHMPMLDLTSETEAHGIWAMEDLVVHADGRRSHGYGHYHERYVKMDGEWRIALLHLKRLRLEIVQP